MDRGPHSASSAVPLARDFGLWSAPRSAATPNGILGNPIRVILLTAALLLVVSSCGDSDEPGRSTASSSSSTQSATTSATTHSTPAETQQVTVWFSAGDGSDCSAVSGITRDISSGQDSISGAFEHLVSGPTEAEVTDGASSPWSTETSAVVRSVDLRDGVLVVDFDDLRPLLPNASTSCGSEALLTGLNQTAFQFSEVERVRYTLDGSCDAFGNWLQRECIDFTRAGQVAADLPTNERASGSGCTPSGYVLGDGRWFGYVPSAAVTDVEFDLACWFTGTAAAAAAAEDGEESPPPNDYYVRNANNRQRTIRVQADTMVTWLPDPGDPATTTTVTYETWLAERSGRSDQPGVWLTIDDGRAASIEEQYVP